VEHAGERPEVLAAVAAWQPRTVGPAVAHFARRCVARCDVERVERAKSLLWASARLGAFAEEMGLELDPDAVLDEAVLERFILIGCASLHEATRRTLRTNLRFVARRAGPLAGRPAPVALPRQRAKSPYSDAEIARFLALAESQPTESRRFRATSVICLGAGAGLMGADLRAVTGHDVVERSGGVVVEVHGRRPRVVPVRRRFAPSLVGAASHFGARYLVGGVEPNRRNVTTPLLASLSGGVDLAPLDLSRLRATWLAAVGASLGLPTFFAAAGVTSSQHLGDVMAGLAVADEEAAVALLAGTA
jgi:hypothetical protein